MSQTPTLRIPKLEFWNLALMCVLGYGGIALLLPAYIGFERSFPGISQIGNSGLAVVLLSGGTVGLFLFRGLFVSRGWWREAVIFGVFVNLVCAAGAMRLRHIELASVVVVLAFTEAFVGWFLAPMRKTR